MHTEDFETRGNGSVRTCGLSVLLSGTRSQSNRFGDYVMTRACFSDSESQTLSDFMIIFFDLSCFDQVYVEFMCTNTGNCDDPAMCTLIRSGAHCILELSVSYCTSGLDPLALLNVLLGVEKGTVTYY